MSELSQMIWELVFGIEEPLGFTINLLITGLFLLAVADVIRGMYSLFREQSWINTARDRLKKKPEACPRGPEKEVLTFLQVPLNSLLGHRICRVIQLRQSGLGHRDVLQQLTAEKMEGYGALARYVGMVLTLLGLLGTVFGLSIALVKIQGSLQSVQDINGLKDLTEALGGTLRGMKTAFACTLAGILTAILTSFVNHILRRKQSACLAHLEDFIICNLLPALESVDPDADDTAKAFANTLSGAAEALDETKQVIVEAAAEYKQSSEHMREIATQLSQTVGTFSQAIHDLRGSQDQFTRTMEANRTTLDRLGTIFDTQFKSMETRMAELQQSSQDLRRHVVDNLEKNQQAIPKTLSTLVDDNQAALNSHLAGIQKMTQEFHNSLSTYMEKSHLSFDNALKQHQDEWGFFSDMVVDFKSSMESLTDHFKSSVENLAGRIEAKGNGSLPQMNTRSH